MPTGGVGCSPLLCLGRLFTHDDDGDDDDYDEMDGDDVYTRMFRPIIYKRRR